MTTKLKGRLLIEENNVPLLGNLKREFVTSTVVTKGGFVILEGAGTVADANDGAGGPFALGSASNVTDLAVSSGESVLNANSGLIISVYEDVGGVGVKARASELTGTAITAQGTEVTIEADNTANLGVRIVDIVGTNNVLVAYENEDTGTDGALEARVLTVDPGDLSIAVAARVTIHTAAASEVLLLNDLTYDSTNDKYVVFYQSAAVGANGSARVGTVTGTSSSWGAEADFTTETPTLIQGTFDTVAGKFVLAWRAGTGGTAGEGNARVGTVSGTTISFGTEANFSATAVNNPKCGYDVTADKTIIAYQDTAETNKISSVAATVTGTDVAFSAEVDVDVAVAIPVDLKYSASLGGIVLAYSESGVGKLIQGTTVGTLTTWADKNQFSASVTSADSAISLMAIPNGLEAEMVIASENTSDTSYQLVHVHLEQGAISNADEWVGVAQADGGIGANVEVALPGSVDCNQSDMTPNVAQFLADAGTLQTADNGRRVGLALSASEILLATTRAG